MVVSVSIHPAIDTFSYIHQTMVSCYFSSLSCETLLFDILCKSEIPTLIKTSLLLVFKIIIAFLSFYEYPIKDKKITADK